MTSSTLGEYSNYLTVPGEEPSPFFSSFSLVSPDEHLVVGFLGGIFFCSLNIVRHCVKDQIMIYITNYDRRTDKI
jgi:hypothetical protein